MSAPKLSNTVKRTCDSLRQGATKQVSDYEQRFGALKNLYDDLLENLIVSDFNKGEAQKTAKEFFGAESVRFAGIDGTLYSRPLFDMVIFFGGAYASTGSVTFLPNAQPKVKYDTKTIQQNMGISSVVPIYVNEIPDVDHTFAAQEQPNEVNPAKPATDEEIANNSLIANAIMTFSEYFLALKLATDPEQNIRILLMDRSLSTERASLLYETRKTSFWHAKSTILGCEVDGVAIDKCDLALARQHIGNLDLGLPPPRADYLHTAIATLLERQKALTQNQLLQALGITDEKRAQRVQRCLGRLVERQVLKQENGVYALNPHYTTTRERIRKLTLELGDKLFFSKTQGTETASSMKITKNGKEHWLTTLDISFLTLFTLQMLLEECWNRRILLVGITKDTAARDFKRQLVPIMHKEDLLKTQMKMEALSELPNTDRMILQSASVFNTDKVYPPWSLIEYDSAFRTMQPDEKHGKGYVSGIIKNKISLEKAFLKTYVQLSQAKTDPLLRSNVLLIDRLAYPEFDHKPQSITSFLNALSDGTKEPVETLLFKDKTVPNKLQNLTMNLLIAMSPVNIPEAFGHNKALFIADKIAKWNYSQFKSVVDSTAVWILNNHKLRKFIFYMSTFRERRSQIEHTRREKT